MEEATELARSVTNGQGADKAIITVGVTTGEHVAQAFAAIRKAGTVVVTGLGNITDGRHPDLARRAHAVPEGDPGLDLRRSNPHTDILSCCGSTRRASSSSTS